MSPTTCETSTNRTNGDRRTTASGGGTDRPCGPGRSVGRTRCWSGRGARRSRTRSGEPRRTGGVRLACPLGVVLGRRGRAAAGDGRARALHRRESVSAVWITTAAVSAVWTARWTPDDESGSSASAASPTASQSDPQTSLASAARRVAGGHTARQPSRWSARCRRPRRGARSGRPRRPERPPRARDPRRRSPRTIVVGRAVRRCPHPAVVDGDDGRPVEGDVPAAGDPEQRFRAASDEGSTGVRWHRPRTAREHRRPGHRRPSIDPARLRSADCAAALWQAWHDDRHTEFDGPVDEQGVEAVAVDEQRTWRHRADGRRRLPRDGHRLDRGKSRPSHQRSAPVIANRSSVAAASVSHRCERRARPRSTMTHAIAELCQSSGDRRACRSCADHGDVGHVGHELTATLRRRT